MLENFLRKMNIPETCTVNNTIYKKLFYENALMNNTDKEIFSKDIEKIIWLYSFKQDTINIKPYLDDEREYEEIAVIEVILVNNTKVNRIAEIIQRSIPYPLVLIFSYKDTMLLNAAHKRKSKADESKNTVEELIYTDWIDTGSISEKETYFFESLNIKEFNAADIYRFYSSFVDRINVFNANKYMGNVKKINIKDADVVKNLTDNIEELEVRISEIRRNMIKEIHFNRKVEMNVELNKLNLKKKQLVEKLGEF